ncbi:hypothetical protein F5B19DRAFT_394023 [Rostrohypoxylon terebratum]|nr:hypothetical protein F5B19DRAFT_394023 [Rostrohypoxylon terebratum]
MSLIVSTLSTNHSTNHSTVLAVSHLLQAVKTSSVGGSLAESRDGLVNYEAIFFCSVQIGNTSIMEPRSAISVHGSFELQISRAPVRSSLMLSTMRRAQFPPLTSLPWELQLIVISFLDVRGTLQLRKTCRLYYRYFTAPVIERLFTANQYITPDLLNCCIDCFAMPPHGRLVQDEYLRRGIWKSMCFRCWRSKRSPDFVKKPKYHIRFIDGRKGYACVLCGWPIRHDQRHVRCNKTIRLMNSALILLSGGYFTYVLMLATTIWMNYPSDTKIVAPSIVSHAWIPSNLYRFVVASAANFREFVFVLSFLTLALHTMKYAYNIDTSHLRFPLEIASTVFWIPSVFHSVRAVSNGTVNWYSYPIYVWIIFSIRMLGHFLNLIGFTILRFGYDPRSPFVPNLSIRKRAVFMLYSLLAQWAQAKYASYLGPA